MRALLLLAALLYYPSPLNAPGEIVNIKTPREAAWKWVDGRVDAKYRWGGNEIKDGGYDCSGLVNGALRVFGVTFADHTAAQLADMFPNVKKENLRYGDLLFWRNSNGKVVHVEMVWAIFENKMYSIGASGGGPWVTTLSDAERANAYVKIHIPAGWAFARNPYGD